MLSFGTTDDSGGARHGGRLNGLRVLLERRVERLQVAELLRERAYVRHLGAHPLHRRCARVLGRCSGGDGVGSEGAGGGDGGGDGGGGDDGGDDGGGDGGGDGLWAPAAGWPPRSCELSQRENLEHELQSGGARACGAVRVLVLEAPVLIVLTQPGSKLPGVIV